jgi:hypothetical protein
MLFQALVRNTGGLLKVSIGTGSIPEDATQYSFLRLDSEGKIYATSTGPIAHYHSGIPFDVNGRMFVFLEGVDPPPDPSPTMFPFSLPLTLG